MQTPDLFHQFWNFIQQLFALDPQEPFKTGAKAAAILGATATVVTTLITKTYPWLRAKIEGRSVSRLFGEDLFTPKSIERAIRYYVPPLCQSIDPAGSEESRLIHSVQAPLFETFDKALGSESEEKYHILLADSGMGKSSAVINYCARHQRRWRNKYQVSMVPLGIPDADERINKIEDKAKTSLFLDALDEDTLAMVDHVERMRLLVRETHEFRKVIITCRTQFFSNDEEIPRETGVLKITARSAGESAEQPFYKIYLAPFSDDQVKTYLKRRYPIWERKRRRQAFGLVAKIPLLSARPMLLAHIDDLVRSNREFQFSYELYEEMVEAWIKREQGFVEDSSGLRDFSERLAVDLYLNRARRGAERVSKDELNELAKKWGIPISDHKLSGRSLLNRDADGNFKFAHRSIMEYLFVQAFLHGDPRCLTVQWTDQMNYFIWERLQNDLDDHLPKKPLFPSLSWETQRDFVIRILMFAVQTPSWPFLLWKRTLLLLCALLLGEREQHDLHLTLWSAGGEKVYPQEESERWDVKNVYQLRLGRSLTYFLGSITSPIVKLERLIVPDTALLLSLEYDYVELIPPWESVTAEKIMWRDHLTGHCLVVPIFLYPGSPSLILIATKSQTAFNNDIKELFSKICTSLRPPVPLPGP